jgi:hypothetical protein
MAFTMCATSYSLESVLLRVGNYEPGEIPLVQIRSDIGTTNPGSNVLVSFTNPTGQGSRSAEYTFTPTAPFDLQAETKYWLFVGLSSTGNITLNRSSTGDQTGEGATLTGNRQSINSGSSFADSSTFIAFQINGTVVPEPTSWVLSMFSVGTLLLQRRRGK